MNSLFKDLSDLAKLWPWYIKKKLTYLGARFEAFKNISVDVLMRHRGSLQKSVWHGSMICQIPIKLNQAKLFKSYQFQVWPTLSNQGIQLNPWPKSIKLMLRQLLIFLLMMYQMILD